MNDLTDNEWDGWRHQAECLALTYVAIAMSVIAAARHLAGRTKRIVTLLSARLPIEAA